STVGQLTLRQFRAANSPIRSRPLDVTYDLMNFVVAWRRLSVVNWGTPNLSGPGEFHRLSRILGPLLLTLPVHGRRPASHHFDRYGGSTIVTTPTVEKTAVSNSWDAAPSVRGAKIPAPAAHQSARVAQLVRTDPEPPRRPRDFSAWRRV